MYDEHGPHLHPVNRYLRRVGTALSILVNVILGGPSNQTLSARNWGWKRQGCRHIVPIINWIFVDDLHCLISWTYWRVRKDVSWHHERAKLEQELQEQRRREPDFLLRQYDGENVSTDDRDS